jgi:O-antigen/teichoic acid export membrane protein
MTTIRRHLGAGAALSVLAQAGPLLALGVLSIVLARTIGPSGNGRFVLLSTLVGILALVVSLGLSAGITYEVSRGRWSVRHAFRTSYWVALPLGLVGVLGGLAFFALAHDTVFRGIGVGVALVALSSVPPLLAYQHAQSIMIAREGYEGYTTIELSHAAAMLLIGAGLALAFGLSGAVFGLPASALIGATIGAVLLVRETRRDATVDTGDSLRRALRFGLLSWGANLLQQVNYRFDIVILGGFAGASAVGIYAVAVSITGLAWVLPQALQIVLFPRTASLDESTLAGEISTEQSDDSLAKALRHGVLLTVPAALLVSVLLLVGVPLLWGTKFSDATQLGFVLLPGVLLLGVAKIVSTAIIGRGRPRYALYGGAIAMPVTVLLYFALIPPFDAWGAAAASSVSYAFSTLLAVVWFRRVTRIGMRQAFVPRAEDVADYGGLVRVARASRSGR